MRVDLIGQDYELEISEIFLMVDPEEGGGVGGGGGGGGRIKSGVSARYGHSPLLVSVG